MAIVQGEKKKRKKKGEGGGEGVHCMPRTHTQHAEEEEKHKEQQRSGPAGFSTGDRCCIVCWAAGAVANEWRRWLLEGKERERERQGHD